MMKKVNEDTNFKPTLDKPVNNQSKGFEKNFKSSMRKFAPDVNLNEVDSLLSEAERSLKKKIFNLAKMETLVFSDPKLSAIYEEMAENGEEKYGYHYNETIQNIIFNDYVLNSPKYLQKYKMTIPKKKKRRDKSGINQLKKAGEERMEKIGLLKQQNNKPEIKEKAELENIGYNHDVINSTNETTGAASSGAYSGPATRERDDDLIETTTSASSGQYSTKYAWGDGDLMKGSKSPVMRKPIWLGGTIIGESNYLTDPSGFEKFVNELNKNNLPLDRNKVNDIIIDKTAAFTSDSVKNWNDNDAKIELNTIKTGRMDNPNLQSVNEIVSSKITTVDQLRQMKANGQKITKDIVPNLAGQALYTIAIQLANRLLPVHWDDLPDTNSMWDYINENGGMTFEDLYAAVKDACNDRLPKEGIDLSDLDVDDNIVNEKAKSKSQQRFMGMVHAIHKGKLNPDDVGGNVAKAAASMSKREVKDFATTKHKGLPEKLDEYLSLEDTVEYVSDRKGENPFDMHGVKWQFVNAKYPNGKIDIGVYRYGHDLVYDYSRWREEMGLNETDQSMIAKPTSTMANYPQSTSELGSGVPTGIQETGEIKESYENNDMTLLEELNKELEAFSIHHQKLMKMAEDRKPSALILKDRIGAENETNFKKDLSQSDTKQIIDFEKELQWKDQQTNVKNPQKLSRNIENNEIKFADMEGDEALKNVGNSDNDNGDEIPKRNLTTKEQEEVNMYRLGQHSLVYDNEPSKRFEERMKKDMGDDIYKIRQKQLEFRGKAPMYNKDTQPTDKGINKVQFDKEESGWNEREGINESMITGRYIDALGKRHIIDFTLGEVKIRESQQEDFFPLDFTGLGNTYNNKTKDYKVIVNEGVINIINSYKFYTDGKSVVAVKNRVQNLTESEHKTEKALINEQVNKMKHLLSYKPKDFINTTNIKKNRGF